MRPFRASNDGGKLHHQPSNSMPLNRQSFDALDNDEFAAADNDVSRMSRFRPESTTTTPRSPRPPPIVLESKGPNHDGEKRHQSGFRKLKRRSVGQPARGAPISPNTPISVMDRLDHHSREGGDATGGRNTD